MSQSTVTATGAALEQADHHQGSHTENQANLIRADRQLQQPSSAIANHESSTVTATGAALEQADHHQGSHTENQANLIRVDRQLQQPSSAITSHESKHWRSWSNIGTALKRQISIQTGKSNTYQGCGQSRSEKPHHHCSQNCITAAREAWSNQIIFGGGRWQYLEQLFCQRISIRWTGVGKGKQSWKFWRIKNSDTTLDKIWAFLSLRN